ncbi:hypothetical protein HS088_TW05G00319 [Tripterygium wilfordii]|uniref:Uncharacterized protein n=1 Tax=Tripterygium wilfordii TaxID=458696 RepID=A0A7J7DN00_TRIWF|nr:hypothetical protein HS088_TW05G00319 [Tripterygium wilfordii]
MSQVSPQPPIEEAMGRQTRSRKPETWGKGKVTPVQVAFLVDRYLSDNNFSETRSVFRTEAASLISKSPVREAPKTLLTLGTIVNEYIRLKEQEVMLDQERVRLEQEKLRVQNLLSGMQEAMNAYNASGTATPAPMIQAPETRPVALVPQSDPSSGSPAGFPVYNSPAILPMPFPSATIVEQRASPVIETPLMRKRAGSVVIPGTAPAAKKSCKHLNNAVMDQGSTQPSGRAVVPSPRVHMPVAPQVQRSNVAKSLFNQPSHSPPTNTSGPNTPPQEAASSQNDKVMTPLGVSSTSKCSKDNTPQEITPNCTIITSERVRVSPFKEVGYYTVERTCCNSFPSPSKTISKTLNKRDQVKGRLDFNGPDGLVDLDKPIATKISTSEPDKEVDLFDMDFLNLDSLGENFSFSELLIDFDLDSEGLSCPCQPTSSSLGDTASGSSNESGNGIMGADQVMSEFSSTVTEVISGKDVHNQGPESLTTMKSVTKCIRILSPAKNSKGSLDSFNHSERS